MPKFNYFWTLSKMAEKSRGRSCSEPFNCEQFCLIYFNTEKEPESESSQPFYIFGCRRQRSVHEVHDHRLYVIGTFYVRIWGGRVEQWAWLWKLRLREAKEESFLCKLTSVAESCTNSGHAQSWPKVNWWSSNIHVQIIVLSLYWNTCTGTQVLKWKFSSMKGAVSMW